MKGKGTGAIAGLRQAPWPGLSSGRGVVAGQAARAGRSVDKKGYVDKAMGRWRDEKNGKVGNLAVFSTATSPTYLVVTS
jgi:hypothetical protein